MATTLRKSDSAAEVEIGKYLDKNFYPHHVRNLVRYNDITHQMAGQDVKFDYKQITNMIVDEKAAAHYVNKDLPTFAFEINFLLQSGQLVDGWFYDNTKATQYYLLAWLWAKKDKGFSADEITKVDLVIIRRSAIIQMLESYNVDHERALRIATAIRENGTSGIHYRNDARPFYFFYSSQLAEQPVNIIIKKSKLIELAIGRHKIQNN